jgi:hypothetical protein
MILTILKISTRSSSLFTFRSSNKIISNTVTKSLSTKNTCSDASSDLIKVKSKEIKIDNSALDDEDSELEDMFVKGPAGMEWGGPTRGGKRPEPTRYGDWERKGRTTDF